MEVKTGEEEICPPRIPSAGDLVEHGQKGTIIGVNTWWHSQSRDEYGGRLFLQLSRQVWEQVLIHLVWWIVNTQPERFEMDCHCMGVEVPGAKLDPVLVPKVDLEFCQIS